MAIPGMSFTSINLEDKEYLHCSQGFDFTSDNQLLDLPKIPLSGGGRQAQKKKMNQDKILGIYSFGEMF